MVIKLKDDLLGSHVLVRVFMGEDKDHLKLTGTLAMNPREWLLFERTFNNFHSSFDYIDSRLCNVCQCVLINKLCPKCFKEDSL